VLVNHLVYVCLYDSWSRIYDYLHFVQGEASDGYPYTVDLQLATRVHVVRCSV
jgi:hypothetical protein